SPVNRQRAGRVLFGGLQEERGVFVRSREDSNELVEALPRNRLSAYRGHAAVGEQTAMSSTMRQCSGS
ncbi:MAG: hypothetical protein AB8B50_20000, partial [Pirellulaceae bacterium]